MLLVMNVKSLMNEPLGVEIAMAYMDLVLNAIVDIASLLNER